MKAMTWSTAIVAAGGLLLTAWVWGASPGADGPAVGRTSSRPSAAAGAQASGPVQGLSDGDRAIFFHLSEGIELVPLSWIKVLKSIKTASPFLEFPERFGLIEDPADPDHLPIGITASTTRGGEMFGRMVGLNCAACHVGAVTRRGQHLAPARRTQPVRPERLLPGALRLAGGHARGRGDALAVPQGPGGAGSRAGDPAQQFLAAVAVASQLDGASQKQAATLFQVRLIEVVKEAVAKAEAEAQPGRPAAGCRGHRGAGESRDGEGRPPVREGSLGLVALVLSSDDPDDPVNAAIKAATDPLLVGVLQQLEVELSLLRSRVRFIAGLQALHAAQRPLPGPGRIDAFDGIRDLVFPRSDAIAADSPVSYPELWLVNQTYWLHWDGNTNSLIQRNIGQALGQGAPFEAVGQGNYHSLVQPVNIHQLETTVRKLTPPEWPAPLFGPIDAAKAARGKVIYEDRCIHCHAARPA